MHWCFICEFLTSITVKSGGSTQTIIAHLLYHIQLKGCSAISACNWPVNYKEYTDRNWYPSCELDFISNNVSILWKVGGCVLLVCHWVRITRFLKSARIKIKFLLCRLRMFHPCLHRKAVKATLVLLPLLGITYMLFFVNPGEDDISQIVFIYFNSFLQSFQVRKRMMVKYDTGQCWKSPHTLSAKQTMWIMLIS